MVARLIEASDVAPAIAVLEGAGVEHAWYLTNTDSIEAVFLVAADDFTRLDVHEVTLEIMRVMPRAKVYVAPYTDRAQLAVLF